MNQEGEVSHGGERVIDTQAAARGVSAVDGIGNPNPLVGGVSLIPDTSASGARHSSLPV